MNLEKAVLDFIRRYSRKPAADKDFEGLALQIFRYQFEKRSEERRVGTE